MRFEVLKSGARLPREARSTAYLQTDNWDDWFKYNTLYHLTVFDADGELREIGEVKIGEFDMRPGQRRPDIPQEFDSLDERFFSLGQDDSYYEALNQLGRKTAEDILMKLRDLAATPGLFDRALAEDVTGISLLRSVSPSTVRGQFQRMAGGGARLFRYEFEYSIPPTKKTEGVTLGFDVEPTLNLPPMSTY